MKRSFEEALEIQHKNMEERIRLAEEVIEFVNVIEERECDAIGGILKVFYRSVGIMIVRNVEDGDYYVL